MIKNQIIEETEYTIESFEIDLAYFFINRNTKKYNQEIYYNEYAILKNNNNKEEYEVNIKFVYDFVNEKIVKVIFTFINEENPLDSKENPEVIKKIKEEFRNIIESFSKKKRFKEFTSKLKKIMTINLEEFLEDLKTFEFNFDAYDRSEFSKGLKDELEFKIFFYRSDNGEIGVSHINTKIFIGEEGSYTLNLEYEGVLKDDILKILSKNKKIGLKMLMKEYK